MLLLSLCTILYEARTCNSKYPCHSTRNDIGYSTIRQRREQTTFNTAPHNIDWRHSTTRRCSSQANPDDRVDSASHNSEWMSYAFHFHFAVIRRRANHLKRIVRLVLPQPAYRMLNYWTINGEPLLHWQYYTAAEYDTIRDAILTCAWKPTWVGLIYRTDTRCHKIAGPVKPDIHRPTCWQHRL